MGQAGPVFVLCTARTGSTLLRFLLDAHPDLACPPETGIPELGLRLAGTWSLLAGAPLQPDRNGEFPELPRPVAAGVRDALEQVMSQHLARRGKAVYCDKTLLTAPYASLLTQLFPEARFICLYRHPMDMIASGIEACPWGLTGFGFESYVAAEPGRDVAALARYWAEQTGWILAAEKKWPDSSMRVRYEDLAEDPEAVADEVFGFLGVSSAPGIAARCFAPERERGGPGDFKIWNTSRVSADSVGRGWSVPVGQLEPAVREAVNALADELGYIRVDAPASGRAAAG
ncbi:MAG TPA: sulfotransferase [Trebonia sp.]|nr:sulfotransferase [Trebonia sp.]